MPVKGQSTADPSFHGKKEIPRICAGNLGGTAGSKLALMLNSLFNRGASFYF
jgi:hypothetical protein